MHFRQAVLREFYGKYIVNPGEMCYALKAEQDTPEMSLFHQLVRKPDSTAFEYQQIHVIASREAVAHACKDFEKNFGQKLKPSGDTYCVAPYTVGLARLGNSDQETMDQMLCLFSDPVHFPQYIMNWLGTCEGYDKMFEDLSEDDPEKKPPEDIRYIIETSDEKDPVTGVWKAKMRYVYDFAEDRGPDEDYVVSRMDEFASMMKPLTQKQLNKRLEYFFMLEDERREREEAVQEYLKFQPLSFKIPL